MTHGVPCEAPTGYRHGASGRGRERRSARRRQAERGGQASARGGDRDRERDGDSSLDRRLRCRGGDVTSTSDLGSTRIRQSHLFSPHFSVSFHSVQLMFGLLVISPRGLDECRAFSDIFNLKILSSSRDVEAPSCGPASDVASSVMQRTTGGELSLTSSEQTSPSSEAEHESDRSERE